MRLNEAERETLTDIAMSHDVRGDASLTLWVTIEPPPADTVLASLEKKLAIRRHPNNAFAVQATARGYDEVA